MNNHESRIKALETRSPKFVRLWGFSVVRTTSTITLSDNIKNYDIIIIEFGCSGGTNFIDIKENWFWRQNIKFNDSATTDNNTYDYALVSHSDIHGINTIYWRSNGTQIYVSGFKNSGAIFAVYGLKIYYIFRYNIYNKIILRIISKISHFFTKIFKYGGEIRDGY